MLLHYYKIGKHFFSIYYIWAALARRRFLNSEKRRRIGFGEGNLKNLVHNRENLKAKQGSLKNRADRMINTEPSFIGTNLQKFY